MLGISERAVPFSIEKKHLTGQVKTTHRQKWEMLAAWHWSHWQTLKRSGEKWTLARRWETMKTLGYPDNEAAFRKLCSRLELSVTDYP